MNNGNYKFDSAPMIDDPEIVTYIAVPRSDSNRATSGERRPELRDYLRFLRKRYRTIITCGLGSALAALIYCAATAPLYTARTTLELRGHAPILSTIASENLFGSDTRKIEYIKTTVAKLKLEGLADLALGHDGLTERLNRYFASRRSLLDRAMIYLKKLRPTSVSATSAKLRDNDLHFLHSPGEIQRYLSLISIEPVHETNLVHIRATTANPQLSQTVANIHATQFIEHLKRERQGSIQANVQLLRAQAEDLKKRVTEAEDQLGSYAAQNKLLLVRNAEGSGLNHRHIESLAQMVADATGKRIKSESALNQARNKREDETSFFDNEITQELRSSLKQAETEYAALGSSVTAAYPGMRELQAKINSLRKAIRDERKQGVQSLQAQYDADLAAERTLRQQVDTEKSQAQEVAKKMIQYDVLSKEASSLRDLYQAVIKQAKEIEMSASVTTSNVFVADYAGLPTSPSAPKSNLIIILMTFVGFTSGILLAYLLESLSDTISTSEEARTSLDLPLLGSVPTLDRQLRADKRLLPLIESEADANKSGNLPPPAGDPNITLEPSANGQLVTISAPHTAISEALRTIRANILLSSADYPPRVILMSSAAQGEGKTTILANLGVTLAQANHRTLVIDGDLRMAGLTELFRSQTGENIGLSELLTGQANLERTIYPTMVSNLDIIPAGCKAPNPAELVGSESMR
ncbi:MAG: GumC family protein, partial [Pseudomonadota bacterium]